MTTMVGKVISHYEITGKLGEGGMGVVYKARDLKLDRMVAIKFLPSHLSDSEETQARFVQEAKAAAALNHPNVLNVYEIDESDGPGGSKMMFIVMELVEGETLRSYIGKMRSGSGISVKQAIEWLAQVAEGLKAAHDKDIIHRDIKPANIMVTPGNRLKVMDFGLAKLQSTATITRAGTSLGTLSYMSPEQARGTPADRRSDIWSLGVVFFEMLTADLPFKAEHEAGLSYLILNEDPPAPSALDRRIPHKVDDLVRKMVEKDRDRRFQGMDELLAALRELGGDLEAIEVGPKKKAVAVLPFENISPDKDNEYFGDGLTEELISNLSRLKDISVVPRTASVQYKGTKKNIRTIGRELGARYILAGSVRKFQDNIRITVEMIDVNDANQVWADSYKGTLADVFEIQEQVSKQIVEALMVKLSPTEKTVLTKRTTVNPEAFDCNLRARDFLRRRTKSSVNMAIQYFTKAISLDTRYAMAYAGLGECYGTIYRDFERRDEWLDQAMDASLKAIMYDSTLSEAYASLALAYLGKKSLHEALESCMKAITLDPNNGNAYWIQSRIYSTLEKDRESVEALEKVLAIGSDVLQVYDDLLNVYERLGEKEKWNEILGKSLHLYSRYLAEHPDDAYRMMAYAVNLTYAGRISAAVTEGERALKLSTGDPIMMYYGACLYSRLGEKPKAVELLKNAVGHGYENFDWIKRDPDFNGIRDEPGYVELMKGR
jgi:serine/threonine protein kinase